MAKYEVTLSMLIATMVKVIVESDSKDDAMTTAAKLLPSNFDPESSNAWKAAITLKPPKGVTLARNDVKGTHFQQASGGEKVKKLA